MNTKILAYLIFIIILSTGNSCKKDPYICPVDYRSIDFENINLPLITENSDNEYIINDDSTYQATFQDWINSSQVYFPDYVLPEIDFSNKTLLGKYVMGTKDTQNNILDRKICLNDSQKEYLYVIELVSTKDKAIHFSMNWILISEMLNGYKVTFEIH